MEGRDTILVWLAHDEITDMEEYVQILKTKDAPMCCKVTLWALALTKTWFRALERPPKSHYTIFLRCTEALPCPECFNREASEQAVQKELARTGAAATEKQNQNKDSDKKGSKGSVELPSKKPAKPSGDELVGILSDDKIEDILNHLDNDFASEERIKKGTKERMYFIKTVLNTIKPLPDYQMLIENKIVDPAALNKILGVVVSAISYLTRIEIEPVFKLVFLLVSNLNGIFFNQIGQEINTKGFNKFLLFVQNTASLSRTRFVFLLDLISALNQKALSQLVVDIINGKVTVSGLKDNLLDVYAKSSAREVEVCKKGHPLTIARIFTPVIVFTHHSDAKSLEELSEENARLKQNIEVLFGDIKYYNSCNLIADLKAALAKKEKSDPAQEGST
ncbi:hypothetical protein NEHOM01_1113 [Nematocida homosporus]|uniref:uncharacterized protein n=1 Tax=Nematocida homosporus TaxID=1912981 RepID=UPI00221E9263|nr:uncharacterized protein NEHOM01_1113 [Nematocida homosporus]KAI5185863.1 hypothetical protein NEHOM01_1113 [Nematocida homosporus]